MRCSFSNTSLLQATQQSASDLNEQKVLDLSGRYAVKLQERAVIQVLQCLSTKKPLILSLEVCL